MASLNVDPFAEALAKFGGQSTAAEQELLAAMAAHIEQTKAAQQLAGQLGQQYEQEVATPPPSLGAPGIIGSLFGNIAAGVSGNPMFAQQTERRHEQELEGLYAVRAEKIRSMRDRYLRAAEIAQQMDQTDKAFEFQQKAHKADALHDQILKLEAARVQEVIDQKLKREDFASRMKELGVTGETAREVARIQAQSRLDVAGTKSDRTMFNETGQMLPDYYRKQLATYRVAARLAKNDAEKQSSRVSIIELAKNRLAGETAADMYNRMISTPDPYRTVTKGRDVRHWRGRQVPSSIFHPDDVADILKTEFPIEEVQAVIAAEEARRRAEEARK